MKFWRVALYEYSRIVFQRRFLFALLSVPALVGMMVLLGFLLVAIESRSEPLGYVDHSGLLANPVPGPTPGPPAKPVRLLPFASEDEARQALNAGEIQAYYVLPADYRSTRKASLVYLKAPGQAVQGQFEDFLRANLLVGQPEAVARRIMEGSRLDVVSGDGRQHMGQDSIANLLVPFVASFAFLMAITGVSGYLMQAVVEEKENRTMEIIVTSVSPLQMMGGKIVAIVGVGVTQILAWFGLAAAILLAGRSSLSWVRSLEIDPAFMGLAALEMLAGFMMVAGFMAAVGVTVTEAREGQQVAGLMTIPAVLPYMFIAAILEHPNGPFAVGLSIFPLTAPITFTMRAALTAIPAWQIAANLLVMGLSALGALWLAGRALRLGMLRYGQRVSLRELFARTAIRPAAHQPDRGQP